MNERTMDKGSIAIVGDASFTKELRKLAERLGKGEAEVVRDALNYYSNAVEEWDRENRPSYCCQRCGDQIGWVGRLLNKIIPGWHRCPPSVL